MKPIAVVVLSWNARGLLERYLPELVRCTPEALADLYLADNGSTDDSIAYAEHLGLGVIALEENFGFAKGYNEAIKQLDHPYVLLLNNDVRVTEGWLEPLYLFMEAHEEVVAVQPKIRWDREPSKYEYAGAEGGYVDYLGYPFCRGRIFDTLEEDRGQYGGAPKEVFWTSGAAMLVRREAYVGVGGLDETFFAHQEEIDLCWRWQREGLKLYVVPKSVVFHYGGASLSASNPRKTYLNFRNNRFMLAKNLPASKRARVLGMRWCLDLLAALAFALQGKWGDAKAVVKAMGEYVTKGDGDVADEAGKELAYKALYRHSLLVRYHVRGEKTFDKLRR